MYENENIKGIKATKQMGFLSFFNRKAIQTATTSDEVRDMIRDVLGGGESSSGIAVTPDRAMQVSAVYACVRVLAESMGQLPVGVFQKGRDGSKTSLYDSDLYEKLHWQPNDFQTSQEFREMMTAHVALRGNGYAFANWKGDKLLELLPFHPGNVEVTQNSDWSLNYKVTMAGGTVKLIPAANMFHLRGITLNGYAGISPIAYHRNTVGLSLATERHGARLFKNGARPGGVLSTPNKLSPDAAGRISRSWKSAHGGDNSGGTAVLEEGMTYASVGMSNEDAQYLETRKFQVEEIARIFRVPTVLLYTSDKTSTYASAEQFFLSFVKFTLLPWVKRWEQCIRRDLIHKADRKSGIYVELNLDGMERGDIKARYEAYGTGIEKGILSANEVRGKENMNPRDGGDDYLTPLNMAVSGEPTKEAGKSASFYQKKDSSSKRHQLRDGYTDAFKKVSAAIVEADVARIRKAAGLHLNKKSISGFSAWLEEYRETAPANIEKAVLSIIKNYGEQIKGAALDDVGLPGSDVPDFAKFLEDHADYFALSYVENGAGQLKALLEDEDPAKEIEQRLSEWEDTRPGKMAEEEVVKLDGLASKFVWAAAGVTALKWMNTGGDTCKFCREMNGKTVGITANFLDAGETLDAGGQKMKVWKSRAVPPLHVGCKCQIVPTNRS